MSNFPYNSLQDGEIRVLELQPGVGNDKIYGSLKVISIDEPEPEVYSALSYTWGADSQPRISIFLEDESFEVRENLFEVLKQLRYPDHTRRLWIDAVCIDQEDDADKKIQIPLMSLIFSKAETVEIWLGTGENNGELGLVSLASGKLDANATEEIVCAVTNLFQRPWFSRVWVIQELVLAKIDAAFVNCGSARVSWDRFSSGVTQITKLLKRDPGFLRAALVPEKWEPQDSFAQIVPNFEFLRIWGSLYEVFGSHGIRIAKLCSQRSAFPGTLSLGNSNADKGIGFVLGLARYAQATLREDKVYGLCGLIGPLAADELMRSYGKTAEEAFFTATLYILRHDTRPNLYHYYPTISPSESKKRSLPSWTLDLSYTGPRYAEWCFASFTKHTAARKPHDKLIISSDGRQMTVDVCIIDPIIWILNPIIVARPPETQTAWNEYFHICKTAGLYLGVHTEISGQDQAMAQRFIEKVNNINFLKEAYEFYQHHAAEPAGIDKVALFWETILSGLDESTIMNIPTDRSVVDQGTSLIGLHDLAITTRDNSVATYCNLTMAQALRFPDPQAATMAVEKADHNVELYIALSAALTLPGCDVPTGFYVTENGLCGLCLPGAQEGDVIARLFRGTGFEIPFVLRPEGGNKYSMVCAASVSKGWEEVCMAQGVVDPEEVVMV